ncbi:MAG: uracil-DNA glycosylase family protein [Elusimicrobia bacterium]|nr:uracil-DNA glycosylase family protein [Elusimicrobiota bacterium]
MKRASAARRTAESKELEELLARVRACRACRGLPLGPRPVVQAASGARLVLIGHAPGRRVHETGVPWDDSSGERLRRWLGIAREEFYDPEKVAVVPMGFCYPGTGPSGDLPPRPECAPLWHEDILSRLPSDARRVLIGRYAVAGYLGPKFAASLTSTIRSWRARLPFLVLPHPSGRNNVWLSRNPWFERDVLPRMRRLARRALERR